MVRIQARSAPAQKALPWPPSTITRSSESVPSWVNAAVSSAITVSLKALRTSGRFRKIFATWRVRLMSRVLVIGSSGLESVALGDFVEHHFGGTAADRQHAGIAPQALDCGVAHVAHAAVELLAGADDLVDQLAGQR